jgi:hypothetical protein
VFLNTGSLLGSVVFNFPTVPANQRLVITQMSGGFQLNTNSTTVVVSMDSPVGVSGSVQFFAPVANQESLFSGPATA